MGDGEHHDQSTADRSAIGLTYFAASSHRRRFGRGIERSLLPHLAALREAGGVSAVLPFRHRPLKVRGAVGSDAWSDYWVIVLGARVDPHAIWSSLEAPARVPLSMQGGLRRAEVLRLQPNIDQFCPRSGGAAQQPKWHWIEYVVSRPESRDVYYQDQYTFSGPVIRTFYEADAVRRFIGFERVLLLAENGTLPDWDVVHITGFAPGRLPQVLWILWRFKPAFDTVAQAAGYPSALEVLHSWDTKRVKYQRLAVQDGFYTLTPLVPGR